MEEEIIEAVCRPDHEDDDEDVEGIADEPAISSQSKAYVLVDMYTVAGGIISYICPAVH